MLPPLKKHRLADQLEPWRKLQAVILEHGFQLRLRHVSSIPHFVGIRGVVNIGLDEQDIINCIQGCQCAAGVSINGED